MQSSDNCKEKIIIVCLFVLNLILLVLVVLFGVRANSKGCVKGLELQYQYQNQSRLLQERLRQSEENSQEMEARWQSCSNDLENLSQTLKEVTSQRNDLKEKNLNLTNKLKETEAALQMEREKNEPNENSSAYTGPQTYSLLLELCLVIALLP